MAGEQFDSTLRPGDLFPRINPRGVGRSQFAVDSMAGRYIVLGMFGSLSTPAAQKAIRVIDAHLDLFDDTNIALFGVSVDPQDEVQGRAYQKARGIRQLWDFDYLVSERCGVLTLNGSGRRSYIQSWIVIDPTLHVLRIFPFASAVTDHAEFIDFLQSLPPPEQYGGIDIPPPILVLPNVLEQDLCHELIARYPAQGGDESGVVRDGSVVLDAGFKRRKDLTIDDSPLLLTLQDRIKRRVFPEISRLFFANMTRIERYIVGCYSAEDGGHFGPHRDNNAGLTEHRRFAVSINLNADFEGGSVRFPEYSRRNVKAPPGWAVVFPCAALHAVSKVVSGRRYAFLPFVYDEAGERLKQNVLQKQQVAAQSEPAESIASQTNGRDPFL